MKKYSKLIKAFLFCGVCVAGIAFAQNFATHKSFFPEELTIIAENEPTPSAEAPKGQILYPAEVVHHKTLLPEDFKVYYHPQLGVSHRPFKESMVKSIINKNEFTEVPGCYIACLTHDAKQGLYSVSTNQYLVGQVRVKGAYSDGLCVPEGFENKDLRADKAWKEKCQASFPEKCINESCRAGGYTAHWFY